MSCSFNEALRFGFNYLLPVFRLTNNVSFILSMAAFCSFLVRQMLIMY